MPKKKGAAVYAKENDDAASKEERLARLKVELKEHIRFLSDFDCMSADWLRMAESLNQISHVAFMESRLPVPEANPLQQEGKKIEGTLWDQQRDEMAVRIVLEEGKLGLVLRILYRYMKCKRSPEFDKLLKETSATYGTEEGKVKDRCNVFEASIGTLLRYTLIHEEAIQILDVPEFVEYLHLALQDSFCSAREPKLPGGTSASDSRASATLTAQKKQGVGEMQSTLVLHYMNNLSSSMENMDEDKVMGQILHYKILPLSIKHVTDNFAKIRRESLENYCQFLSNVMNSDAFATSPGTFVTDEAAQKSILNLKGLFIQEVVDTGNIKRASIQKLLDVLAKYEQSVGTAQAE